MAEQLTIGELETALSACEVLEEYPDDPRGQSCLVLGFMPRGRAVHVCGQNSLGHLVWITVYVPSRPKWLDERTRNR